MFEFENRRYKRFDVSKDKIVVFSHEVSGFTVLGFLKDISKGGLQFKSDNSINWKPNEPVTLYLQLPDEEKLTPIDVRPIRSNRKLFSSFHAGEFIGSLVPSEAISPMLEQHAEAELVGAH